MSTSTTTHVNGNGNGAALLRPRAIKPLNQQVLRTLTDEGIFKPSNGLSESSASDVSRYKSQYITSRLLLMNAEVAVRHQFLWMHHRQVIVFRPQSNMFERNVNTVFSRPLNTLLGYRILIVIATTETFAASSFSFG